MGEIFNLDDMIKKEMKGFKKDENSSAKPSEYLREYYLLNQMVIL